MPDDERSSTFPYGVPTEAQVESRIHREVQERVARIEHIRRMDMICAVLRQMTPADRKEALKQIVKVFGEEAGLKGGK